MVLMTVLLILMTFTLLPQRLEGALENTFLFFPSRTLDATPDVRGLAYEDVRFAADDGVILHGWFIPYRTDAPALLFFHGNAGNISHRIENLALLNQLGLNVLIFDYRGYGQSEGRPSEPGTYRDGRAARTWLAERGWDSSRIILFGRSLGSAVAMKTALDHPPAGLVLESPFTSVRAMGRLHYPVLSRLLGWMLTARYDTLSRIDRLACPLLIFQGDRDTTVPEEMARELFDRAKEPKSFHLIEGAGHNDTFYAGGSAYLKTWRDFLKTSFPPGAPLP